LWLINCIKNHFNLWNNQLSVYIFIFNKISLLFHPIFLNLTCQCGKPFFSNTRQNGKWTETSTRQNEIELAIFFKLTNKYQINNTVMFNNLFCRFWQVINLVKKDQHSLKISYSSILLSSSSSTEVRKYRLLSFNVRYKTCMSNPVRTHI
jgi:hypothetical protein